MTREALDLRLAPLALAAWAGAAVSQGWSAGQVLVSSSALVLASVGCLGVGARWRRATWSPGGRRGHRHDSHVRLVAAATLVVAAGATAAAGFRGAAVEVGPVSDLARDGATVDVVMRVTGDPVPREGQFGPYLMLRTVVEHVAGRGQRAGVRSPVLVIAEPDWSGVRYGELVAASGRLGVASGPDLAGVFIARGPPERLESPGFLDRAVARVRAGINEAAAPLPETERVLVPALVNGDDTGMPERAVDDFRATGLTHLLAVSGANVTLVLGFIMVVARWCRVRGRWLTAVGVLAVVFFVLIARPQPSVLRAAAMGVVAIVGLSAGGRTRGVRALCLAVLVLVLVDPWLARSVGFLLSVLATGGILLLAPIWRDAMARWTPQVLAELIAVPLAAQVVCTPVVAAISGEVSVVAVLANVLAAPAVGPTTVLGFAGGLVATAVPSIGHLIGFGAGCGAWWIVLVARHGASLDGASVTWPLGVTAIVALTLLCLGQIVVLTRLLRHRWPCLLLAVITLLYVVHPPARPGWPPEGWRLVMCDVGQGDALVLNAGGGAAVVVDAGPDPDAVDRCLDRLRIDEIALVVLTHFHADHVDGLPGVLDGRHVLGIDVSPLPYPAYQAQQARATAADAGVPVWAGATGTVHRVGEVALRTLGPLDGAGIGVPSPGNEGSGPNNASLVVHATVGDVEVLLAGDSELEEQSAIVASGADLQVDVLKVAHHGSSNQDPDFVSASQARVALISVGADNSYGHPSSQLLGLLRSLGAQVYRTDQSGDVAVVERAGALSVVPWN